MSAGYDGNITLGVSVNTDSKSVVAELGALRKQIVDMFSSVDKSLAGGSGSFSNLEKTLTNISTDVAKIGKALSGLPKVTNVADGVKEIGTAAQQAGKEVQHTAKLINGAFTLDVTKASTEELYQHLRQFRAEMEEIKKEGFQLGMTENEIGRSQPMKARSVWTKGITTELGARGFDTSSWQKDYTPKTHDIGGPNAEEYKHSIEEVTKAYNDMYAKVAEMDSKDPSLTTAIQRTEELEARLASLTSAYDKLIAKQAEADAQSGGSDVPVSTSGESSHDNAYQYDTTAIDKYQTISATEGQTAAEEFYKQFNAIGASQGAEAAHEFAKNFRSESSGDSAIASTKQELMNLQHIMKDFDKGKIKLSDEDVGKNLNRIEELKAKLAELTADAKFIHMDTPVDDNLRQNLKNLEDLQHKVKQFQTTGTGFGSAEEAQGATAKIAELNQTIAEYFRNLDPGIQKMHEFQSALAELQGFKEKTSAGTNLTAEEAQQYDAAITKVNQYKSSLQDMIQIRNSMKAAISQYEKTGTGMSPEQFTATKAALVDVERQIGILNGTRIDFDTSVSNQKLVDLRTKIQELTATKKQMESQGMGAGYTAYDDLIAQLGKATTEYNELTHAATKASGAVRAMGVVTGIFRGVHSVIRGLIHGVHKLTQAFHRLGIVSTHSAHGMHKSLKRSLMTVLRLAFGVRGMFALIRRLRTAIIGSFGTLAQQFPEINAQLSETKTLMTGLKGSLATAFQPLLTAVLPAINAIIRALTTALTYLGQFFAALTGQGFIYKATANQQNYADSLKGTGGAAKEATKALMGFDEINKLDDPDKGGGGGNGFDGTYEKVPITDNPFTKFAEMLKEAWAKGDFTEIGELIGTKLRDGLLKVDEWITTKGFALAKKLGHSFATLINGIVNVDGLADAIGTTVADAINMGIIGIKEFLDVTEWHKVGEFIGDTIMGFFNTIKWAELGQTIGAYVKAFTNTIWAAIKSIDFQAIGDYLADAFNGIFDVMGKIDPASGFNGWQELGQSISNMITGLLEMMIHAIENADWTAVGQAIGDVLSNIDWGRIVIDVGKLIWALIKGIAKGIAGWAKTDPISAALTGLFVLAFAGIKFGKIFMMAKLGSHLMGLVNSILGAHGLGTLVPGCGTIANGMVRSFAGLPAGLSRPFGKIATMGGKLTSMFGKIPALLSKIPAGFVKAFGGVGMVLSGSVTAIGSFFDMWKNGFSWLKEAIMGIGIALVAVGAIILGAPALVVGVIAAVVAALATLAVVIKEHWTEICNWCSETWAALCDWVSEKWTALCEWWTETWTSIKEGWNNFWTGVKDKVVEIFTACCDWISDKVNAFKEWWSSTWSSIKEGWTNFWTSVKEISSAIFTACCDWISDKVTAFKEWWSSTWTAIKEGWSNFWTAIKEKATELFTTCCEWVREKWTGFKDWFTGTWDALKTGWNGFWDGLKEKVTAIWDSTIGYIQEKWEKLTGWFSETWSNIKSGWGNFWGGVKDKSSEVWGQACDGVSQTWDNFSNTWTNSWSGIKDGWGGLWGNMKDKAGNMIGTACTTVATNWNSFASSWSSSWAGVTAGWTAFWLGLKTIAVTSWGDFGSWLTESVTNITTVLTEAYTSWTEGWTNMWTGLQEVAVTAWTTFSTWLMESITTISTYMMETYATVTESWTMFWTNLVTVVTEIWTGFCEWFLTAYQQLQLVMTENMLLIQENWVTAWTTIRDRAFEIWTNMVTSITTFCTQIKMTITQTMTMIQNFWTLTWTLIKTFAINIMNSLRAFVLSCMNALRGGIISAMNSIRSNWVSAWSAMASHTASAMSRIASIVQGGCNRVIGYVNRMLHVLASGINGAASMINSISMTIPQWVPRYGGNSFNPRMSHVSAPHIPYLASGAVIPPNSEFLAMLGDQKHGTNIEAPLDTIKQAVGEELVEYLDAMMAGFNAVVDAINEKDLDVQIGDSTIGKAAERYNRRQSLARGGA